MKILKAVKYLIVGFFVFVAGAGYGYQTTAEYVTNRTKPELTMNPLTWIDYVVFLFCEDNLS